ncbi:MAG: FAD-containing oxidoreductase [Bryobacterales bacterium]|nr:FAD-containing oxidoreductase [Bryobacterales bacterium]
MTHYDAIVIGTGQAGPSLAVRLAEAGRKVAVIERKRFGGTCVNTGCIPTKALVASARAAWVARNAAAWGVETGGPVRVDMRKVKARKDGIVGQFRQGLSDRLRNTPGCDIHLGHARLEGPHSVRVNERRLEAPLIFLNVGGRAAAPPIPGLDSAVPLNNSSMMEVDFLPERLIILGGGYIACEFAQMYRRFGSEVTIVERDSRLLSREDPDVSDAVREMFEAEGIRVLTGAGIRRVSRPAVVETSTGTVSGSHLLAALGRVPNTHDLGLETAGIEADSQGFIKVDDRLRTTAPGVYALGECNGHGAFTHTAYNDYEIAAANLLDGENRRISDRIPAYAIYTDPPLGRAGMTETQARASGRPVLMAKWPMTRVGRAVEKGETRGFLKLLVDAETGMIAGASLLGVECDEVVHSILDVMYARAPYTAISRAMHIHPTVSELIPTALQNLKPLEVAATR